MEMMNTYFKYTSRSTCNVRNVFVYKLQVRNIVEIIIYIYVYIRIFTNKLSIC